jgi:hypothetical protein
VEDLPRPVLSGFVFQNSEDCPHPVFFVSADSERLRYSLTSLESTLLDFSQVLILNNLGFARLEKVRRL